MNTLNINLLEMDERERHLVNEFLSSNKDKVIFSGFNYDIKDSNGEEYKIYFSHNLIYWQCNWNPEEFRYELIDRDGIAGIGAFATVYRSSGSLVPQEDGSLGLQSSNYVVKMQKHLSETSYIKRMDGYIQQLDLMQEAELTRLSGLSIKKPSVFAVDDQVDFSGTVMKYYGQDDLWHGILSVDSADLCVAILLDVARTVKKQLHDKGIVHRDLKPGNILIKVDSVEQRVAFVTIIDFGLSHKIENPPDRVSGSFAYVAPELFADKPATFGCDIYSLGKVFTDVCESLFKSYSRKTRINSICYVEDFSDHDDKVKEFSDDDVSELTNIISAMINPNPDERWNIDQIICKLEELQRTRNLRMATEDLKAAIDNNDAIALSLRKKLLELEKEVTTANNAPCTVKKIQETVSWAIEQLHHESSAIKQFVMRLGIKFLEDCTSKQALEVKLKTLFDSIHARTEDLRLLENKLPTLKLKNAKHAVSCENILRKFYDKTKHITSFEQLVRFNLKLEKILLILTPLINDEIFEITKEPDSKKNHNHSRFFITNKPQLTSNEVIRRFNLGSTSKLF